MSQSRRAASQSGPYYRSSLSAPYAGERRIRAFSPWAVVCVLLFLASIWLMTQPMDMRATMMAG
jgi:uncharacterized membrane protein (GlpM family)